MRWPFGRPQEPATRLPHARPMAPPTTSDPADDHPTAGLGLAFVCRECGREDLPPAGDWNPPVCMECDAAINFDASIEAGYVDDELGLR
jgi:hypothetical protein